MIYPNWSNFNFKPLFSGFIRSSNNVYLFIMNGDSVLHYFEFFLSACWNFLFVNFQFILRTDMKISLFDVGQMCNISFMMRILDLVNLVAGRMFENYFFSFLSGKLNSNLVWFTYPLEYGWIVLDRRFRMVDSNNLSHSYAFSLTLIVVEINWTRTTCCKLKILVQYCFFGHQFYIDIYMFLTDCFFRWSWNVVHSLKASMKSIRLWTDLSNWIYLITIIFVDFTFSWSTN